MSASPGILDKLPRAPVVARTACTAAVLSAVWWTLTEGEASAWYIGVPAIAFAVFANIRAGPLGWPGFAPMATLRFIAFFIWESFAGGIDVASRVLRRRLRIEPGVLHYRWRLPPGGQRVLAIATLSLQPGTLAVRDEGRTLEVHLLDQSIDLTASMQRLESLIAAMLRIDLLPQEHGS